MWSWHSAHPSRAAQPHGAERAHAVGAVLREVFLGLKPAFGRRAVQAVVGRRDPLLDGRVRQQVSGDLLARELVERFVVRETRAARSRDRARQESGCRHGSPPVSAYRTASSQCIVRCSAYRGEASRRSTTFSYASGAVSARNARVSSGVGGRPVRSSVTRRSSVRLSASLRRRQPSRRSRSWMKLIDRVLGARCVRGGGHGRPRHRLIRPMALVDRAFRDPAANRVLLCLRSAPCARTWAA